MIARHLGIYSFTSLIIVLLKEKRLFMTKVILKKGEGRSLKKGGPWIYDNEILRIEGSYENGDIVDVYDYND